MGRSDLHLLADVFQRFPSLLHLTENRQCDTRLVTLLAGCLMIVHVFSIELYTSGRTCRDVGGGSN